MGIKEKGSVFVTLNPESKIFDTKDHQNLIFDEQKGGDVSKSKL